MKIPPNSPQNPRAWKCLQFHKISLSRWVLLRKNRSLQKLKPLIPTHWKYQNLTIARKNEFFGYGNFQIFLIFYPITQRVVIFPYAFQPLPISLDLDTLQFHNQIPQLFVHDFQGYRKITNAYAYVTQFQLSIPLHQLQAFYQACQNPPKPNAPDPEPAQLLPVLLLRICFPHLPMPLGKPSSSHRRIPEIPYFEKHLLLLKIPSSSSAPEFLPFLEKPQPPQKKQSEIAAYNAYAWYYYLQQKKLKTQLSLPCPPNSLEKMQVLAQKIQQQLPHYEFEAFIDTVDPEISFEPTSTKVLLQQKGSQWKLVSFQPFLTYQWTTSQPHP